MKQVSILSRRAKNLWNKNIAFYSQQNLWTSDNVVKSPYKEVSLPSNSRVAQHIWNNLEKWADKTATICGITNRSYTYHQLYKYSRNLAAKLRVKLQIRDGDVVCVMMPNIPEYPLAVLGISEAGAILTTINPIYTTYEVHRQLVLSNTKVAICVPETVPIIKEACKQAQVNIPIIVMKEPGQSLPEGTISFQELIENDDDISSLNDVRSTVEDIAILPYSSGTTGLPKGVELTNYTIVANCAQQDGDDIRQYSETTAEHQDSVMCVLPFFHIYGLTTVMLHKLSFGAKLVTLPKFQTNTFINSITEQKISRVYAAPPIVLFLGSHPDVKPHHLDSVRTLVCGAAPLPKNDIDRVLEKSQNKLQFLQMYGLTEASPLVTTMRPGSKDYTTSGFALPNTELRIVDSNSQSLGPDEVGELLIKGPQVMKGYQNNPEATKATITDDGWLKTGDLVKMNKDGSITVADRLKELIKVKGFQVPPAELENIIKEHPKVLDVAVIGVPDTRLGEAPKAFVVLREGHEGKAKEIQDFVKERVAEYKRVKDVVFISSLPKNPSGKILRRVLKEEYS